MCTRVLAGEGGAGERSGEKGGGERIAEEARVARVHASEEYAVSARLHTHEHHVRTRGQADSGLTSLVYCHPIPRHPTAFVHL
jgi:hypothetical protein